MNMDSLETHTAEKPKKLQISSHGKRLFALLFDAVFAILLVNTIRPLTQPQHWDVLPRTTTEENELLWIYGAIALLLLSKDIFGGRSPGKYIWGMCVRSLQDLSKPPNALVLIARNSLLAIFPIEGIATLFNSHGRRFADRWLHTVVIDHPNTIRPIFRILLANVVLVSFFFAAWISQPYILKKSVAYQTAEKEIYAHPIIQSEIGNLLEINGAEMTMQREGIQRKAYFQAEIIGTQNTMEIQMELSYNQNRPLEWQVVNISLANNPISLESKEIQIEQLDAEKISEISSNDDP